MRPEHRRMWDDPDAPVKLRRSRKRTCVGCLFRITGWSLLLAAFGVGIGLLSFVVFPPFGADRTAKVLLVGLDDEPRQGGARRSDTIILCAAPVDRSQALLLSVPRDAAVRIPGYRSLRKINAAYALGDVDLLKDTLAQSQVMQADLPYHMVFDSDTVRAVVDALGGVEVDVPFDMDYDDNWGNLHIHLKAGRQILNGEQAVGYLRWRKNNRGRVGDDFDRGERQREVVIAMTSKLRTWKGAVRIPAVYRAFRATTRTNMNNRQLAVLGWALQETQSATVPGRNRMIRGISFVDCDWQEGRRVWYEGTH